MNQSNISNNGNSAQGERIAELQRKLNDLADGNAVFSSLPDVSADIYEAGLKDILEFESVESGVSLFEGLQQNGIDLPHPDRLDEFQSKHKAMEVFHALADLQIFLIGFEKMDARKFYSTLWHQTLWEGCYVKQRQTGAITLIDVSHKMLHSDIKQYLEDLTKAGRIQ